MNETKKMQIYCAWCGKFLKLVKCTEKQSSKISHGICQQCYQKTMAELEKINPMPAKKKN